MGWQFCKVMKTAYKAQWILFYYFSKYGVNDGTNGEIGYHYEWLFESFSKIEFESIFEVTISLIYV